MLNEHPRSGIKAMSEKVMPDLRKFYEDLGMEIHGEETVESEKVKVAMVQLGESRQTSQRNRRRSDVGRVRRDPKRTANRGGSGTAGVAPRIGSVEHAARRNQPRRMGSVHPRAAASLISCTVRSFPPRLVTAAHAEKISMLPISQGL